MERSGGTTPTSTTVASTTTVTTRLSTPTSTTLPQTPTVLGAVQGAKPSAATGVSHSRVLLLNLAGAAALLLGLVIYFDALLRRRREATPGR